MRKLPYFLLVVATVLPTTFLVAQTVAPADTTALVKRTLFFDDERPVDIALVSNFRKLQSDKKRGVFQDATVTLKLPDKEAVTEGIKLSARGEFRRQECVMPSIMLDFKNPSAPKLSNLKKLKVVCGCSASG